MSAQWIRLTDTEERPHLINADQIVELTQRDSAWQVVLSTGDKILVTDEFAQDLLRSLGFKPA